MTDKIYTFNEFNEDVKTIDELLKTLRQAQFLSNKIHFTEDRSVITALQTYIDALEDSKTKLGLMFLKTK
jgi:hypothetical protein